MKNMKWLYTLTSALVIVGALNWGLTALNYNIVTTLLGAYPTAIKVLYGAIGVSGIVQIYHQFMK